MKTLQNVLALLLVLAMIFALCACGNQSADPTDGNSNSGTDGTSPSGGSSTGEPKPDTWENAMGQSGVMEYEYKRDALKKATFKYGNTDNVWRNIEYGSFEDNAVGIRHYETHRNSNNEVIFSLDIRYFEEEGSENVPQYITGHDYFYDETSCDLKLQSDGMIIETMIANTYIGAQDYWITKYASNGLPAQTAVYSREGSKLCTWLFYHEDGRIAYGRQCNDYYADATPKKGYVSGTTFKFEYDGNGKLLKLVEGYGIPDSNGQIANFQPKEQRNPENSIGVTFAYDDQGRLSKRTQTGSILYTSQVFTYDDEGAVSECEFISGSVDSTRTKNAYFEMDADSLLASADFGNLSNADTSYYEFQYYGNGILSHITAYDESARNSDEEYLDIEWEKDFYESGKLKSETKYKSSYMKYYTDFYDEDGNETGSESGTYTEDGIKPPVQTKSAGRVASNTP